MWIKVVVNGKFGWINVVIALGDAYFDAAVKWGIATPYSVAARTEEGGMERVLLELIGHRPIRERDDA